MGVEMNYDGDVIESAVLCDVLEKNMCSMSACFFQLVQVLRIYIYIYIYIKYSINTHTHTHHCHAIFHFTITWPHSHSLTLINVHGLHNILHFVMCRLLCLA